MVPAASGLARHALHRAVNRDALSDTRADNGDGKSESCGQSQLSKVIFHDVCGVDPCVKCSSK